MGLVRNEYEIDEDALAEKADAEGGYWEKSYNFYMDVKDQDYADMTPSQLDWLFRIEKRLEQG